MSAPATVVAFYSQPHWGLRFGVVDTLHPSGHRGQDIVHDAGTPVPALRAGLVVNVQFSSIIGTVVVIQVSDADFDGYAHTRNVQVARGQQVTQGQQLAEVAGYGDAHGTAWAGPHTHLTNSPNGTGIFQGTVRDPLPVITATLTATAGGGTTPLEDNMPAYSLLAVDEGSLLNTWIYIGLPTSFVLSGDPGNNQAEKETICAINGVKDVPTLEANVVKVSTVAGQIAIGHIPTPAATIDANALATALAPLIGHYDPTVLAAAVTTALAPQLATIPAAVVKAEGAALANG